MTGIPRQQGRLIGGDAGWGGVDVDETAKRRRARVNSETLLLSLLLAAMVRGVRGACACSARALAAVRRRGCRAVLLPCRAVRAATVRCVLLACGAAA